LCSHINGKFILTASGANWTVPHKERARGAGQQERISERTEAQIACGCEERNEKNMLVWVRLRQRGRERERRRQKEREGGRKEGIGSEERERK
jgi:hypothetical protein